MSSPQDNSVRRYDLDGLRIFATILLIPYHTARIFDSNPFYVKNDINYRELELFTSFINPWFMPLFFFIAGAAVKCSLDNRSKKQYCLERFKRLFIPLIFGVFILIPPIGYFGYLYSHNMTSLPYFQYYPYFFRVDFKNIDGYTGTFTPSHLWFILYLFCFSFMTLPLFCYLKSRKSKYLISQLAEYLLQKRGRIFLWAIPLALARMVGVVYYNPVYLILFFNLGYLVLLDKRFERSMDNNNLIAFILGIIGMFLYLFSGISEFSLVQKISLKNVFFQFLLSLNTWCWVILILNGARKYLNQKISLSKYLNQASYPIYILHMTFIVPISFYIVQLQVGVMSKFLLITFTSSIGIIIVYDSLIKRFNVMRFLFGMKLKN